LIYSMNWSILLVEGKKNKNDNFSNGEWKN